MTESTMDHATAAEKLAEAEEHVTRARALFEEVSPALDWTPNPRRRTVRGTNANPDFDTLAGDLRRIRERLGGDDR